MWGMAGGKGVCGTHGEEENKYRILLIKPEPLVSLRID
jgi:hypothetical protein